ncbi:MAG: AAA family ATPase [Actinomycetia bacterium]|nr:AAA family ATPase [Actinomycetes bacterium]
MSRCGHVYEDASGRPVFRVVRLDTPDGKRVWQEHPTGSGWEKGLGGAKPILYRLPQVVSVVQAGRAVHVVEGEKCADALNDLGLVATTNPGGAGKWQEEFSENMLANTDCVVWADCDKPGRGHANQVAQSLARVGCTVHIADLDTDRDDGYDIADRLRFLQREDVTDEQLAGHLRDTVEDVRARKPVSYTPDTPIPEVEGYATGQGPDDRPFAVPLDEFLAEKTDTKPALIGTEEDTVLPAGGLMLLAGRSGEGKTTLANELAFHLAAGAGYLDHPIERPLRVLLIENEGPQEPFRQKLERKHRNWRHQSLDKNLYIHTHNWAAFRLDQQEARSRLAAFTAHHGIDVVIADPLGSLGDTGAGSPKEAQPFIELLKQTGLYQTVAWIILHHLRKPGAQTRVGDELDEISGAWVQHADAVLTLKARKGNQARLSYPKLRWGKQRPAAILSFDPDTETFTHFHNETAPGERDLRAELTGLLADGVWRTARQCHAPKRKGGIGAGRAAVEQALEDNPDLFEQRPGKELGRPKAPVCYSLAELARDPVPPVPPEPPDGQAGRGWLRPSPLRGGKGQASQQPLQPADGTATNHARTSPAANQPTDREPDDAEEWAQQERAVFLEHQRGQQ